MTYPLGLTIFEFSYFYQEIQIEIDKILKEFPGSRSFVRASGTEDIVRILAETDSLEDSQEIAKRI